MKSQRANGIMKHHEYVGDIDYRPIVRGSWDKITLTNNAKETHKKLLKEQSDLPYRDVSEKNSDAHSDIYNHVIGYVQDFPVQNVQMDTESAFQHAFNFKLEYDRVISSLIRKAATLYSLHDAYTKYGRFNDPICLLYDEPKNNFHVCFGQQRYYYAKVMGAKLDAIVYSLGTSAAKKIEEQVSNVDWDWNKFKKDFYFESTQRSIEEYNKTHLMLSLSYDKDRDKFMQEHSNHILDFAGILISFDEEYYFYTEEGSYLFFIGNQYANKKVKVTVKDTFGVIQFILSNFCDIDPKQFIMDKRFKVGNF